MFVVYHVAFDKQKDISTYSSGYGGGYGAYGWGWGGGWGGGTTTTQVRDILVGTLVIDMADAKKDQLAWRGMGVKEVNTQANPEKRDKSINNAVKKIFKNYPPKVKTVAGVSRCMPGGRARCRVASGCARPDARRMTDAMSGGALVASDRHLGVAAGTPCVA